MAFFNLAPLGLLFVVPPLDRTPLSHVYLLDPILLWLEEQLLRFHAFVTRDFLKASQVSEYLVYSDKNWEAGKWWTAFTHMAVHKSYQHLMSNVLSLFCTGLRPYCELGPGAFYSCFVSGGCFGALNHSLKDLQFKRQVQPWLSLPASFPLSESLQTRFRVLSESSSEKLTKMVRPHLRYIGCSAGVMSLAGLNFAMGLEDFVDFLLDPFASKTQLQW